MLENPTPTLPNQRGSTVRVQNRNDYPGGCPYPFPPRFRQQRQRVFFINGIWTSKTYYEQVILHLSSSINRSIEGVYNRTNGIQADVNEAVRDYLLPMKIGPEISSSETERVHYFRQLFSENRTTRDLYDKVFQSVQKHQHIYLICHSQGCLITSNVLWAIVHTKRPHPLSRVFVYALGSPAPSWPQVLGIRVRRYANIDDPIAYLERVAELRGYIGGV